MTLLHGLLLCLVPLFVAVDAIGVLPLFISLTAGVDPERRRRIIAQSMVTALVVALAFVVLGQAVFRLLGVSVPDFMIAGGLLLFAIAMNDLLAYEVRRRQVDAESLGVVPIGVPLITGPAVLTTSLILVNQHGVWLTAAAILINVAIAGGAFSMAEILFKVLGKSGSKAVSKVASLFLAAIAVMMVRKGITGLIAAAAADVVR